MTEQQSNIDPEEDAEGHRRTPRGADAEGTEDRDDVEGHRGHTKPAADAEGDDDVEGHRGHMKPAADAEGDDEVEGHRWKPGL